MLKLTEHVGITIIFLLYKQKTRWNSDIQNFYSEILIFFFNFRLFFAKNRNFRSGMFLWRHNYVTPWLIVLILVCVDREGPYLPFDAKINVIGCSIWKIFKNNPPPFVRRVTKKKKSEVTRGLIRWKSGFLRGFHGTPSYARTEVRVPYAVKCLGELHRTLHKDLACSVHANIDFFKQLKKHLVY